MPYEDITRERILSANGNALAQRIIDITGTIVKATYCKWDDETLEEAQCEELEFPNSTEEVSLTVLGDNSLGGLVDIWNNMDGDLILRANFGDEGNINFNVHRSEFLSVFRTYKV